MAVTDPGTKKRYDRQVRLWGAHGQARLEASRVCAIGAGPMCTEALKNLVLGGIASFTIVDNKNVSEDDLRNNFFFERDQLGQGRAESACKLLRELNDEVKGSFSDADVCEKGLSHTELLKDYNLVIVEQMPRSIVKDLQDVCSKQGTAMIVLRSQGPFASVQLTGPEMCIIESKPDTVPADLRIVQPWPELQALADSIDLETCDDITHKHTPWALLLIKAVNAWRLQHGGAPSNAAERRAFKATIQGWQRTIDGIPVEEENFTEAIRQAHTAWTPSLVPSHIQGLFDDPACANLTSSSDIFWVLLAAVRKFVDDEGAGSLPLEGSIPDMTATTELYLSLQRVYRARADAHCAAVRSHALALLKSLGRDDREASPEAVKLFCKQVRHVRVVRPRPAVLTPAEMLPESLKKAFDQDDQSLEAAILLVLHAADLFYEQHGTAPGASAAPEDPAWEQDIATMQTIVAQLAADLGLPAGGVRQDVVLEFCRGAGPPLHAVAAVVGGVAAQEGLKTILRQFVPLNGTLVYNGIHACSAVFVV